jgi:hypothetical protein
MLAFIYLCVSLTTMMISAELEWLLIQLRIAVNIEPYFSYASTVVLSIFVNYIMCALKSQGCSYFAYGLFQCHVYLTFHALCCVGTFQQSTVTAV